MAPPENSESSALPVRRAPGALKRAYAFMTSTRLAIALLIGALGCCIVGVTAVRGARAWELIFSTFWFNALLVLLALSSGAAFFTRIWRRKLTVVSAGMILFHMSFVSLLGGVVFNGLFHFKGVLRLTEGEALRTDRLESYDAVEHGRFFDVGRLHGEATLLKVHPKYKVYGEDKRVAYEISVGEGESKRTDVIYVTHSLTHDGVRYFNLKEGYSVLVVMSDKAGREIYGSYIPLQSLKQEDGKYLYATGTSLGAQSFPYPLPPEEPRVEMLLIYRPNAVMDRAGEVKVHVAVLGPSAEVGERIGDIIIGGKFDAGEFILSPKEIRYWVGMDVRYDPGLTVILSSLSLGLAGMVITFVGRVRRGPVKKLAA